MVIHIWLRDAAEQLANIGIASALLDAEIILAHTLRKSRTWIHAHNDATIPNRELEIANARLSLRLERVPVAYIIGHKWFYGRQFKVTPATLIPRPESESLITLLNNFITQDMSLLVDVGTGTGCLGITAKLEHPSLTVFLADISRHALQVAKQNADTLRADVTSIKSDLLEKAPPYVDILIANLPYVDRAWERSPETNCEPPEALFANQNGTSLIYKLIRQSTSRVNDSGLLIIEADPFQHDRIITYATKNGLSHLHTDGYGIAFTKLSS
ncbi:peptide chain release factor N(5)-glutamine methyltransferase [Candidatus Saccharibacteria bacterium]|nr:peptide chain release factor N(5)-glutamine methyltransferase [Candidatus Saccharibacteria bacterium]